MITYVMGYKNSGKSKYAEDRLRLLCRKTLYIGTLPDNVYHADTIRRHKVRRPADWELIELEGDPHDDIACIQREYLRYDCVLLDGLAFYIARQLMFFPDELLSCKRELFRLLNTLAASDRHIMLVDTPVTDTMRGMSGEVVSAVHRMIINRSEQIIYVENTIPREITAKEARQLDERRKAIKAIEKEATNQK